MPRSAISSGWSQPRSLWSIAWPSGGRSTRQVAADCEQHRSRTPGVTRQNSLFWIMFQYYARGQRSTLACSEQPTGNGPQCRLVVRWESQAPMRRRNATATTVVAIAATQSTSNEPSPPSGAVPNSFSMKSMAISFVQRGGIEGSSRGQPEGHEIEPLKQVIATAGLYREPPSVFAAQQAPLALLRSEKSVGPRSPLPGAPRRGLLLFLSACDGLAWLPSR